MNRFILLFFIFFLFNCSLSEPCTLIIENKSDYTIDILISNGNKSKITLNKNKGDFILVSPGQIDLKVIIESMKYSKKYSIKINYLEKKKFIFNLDK